MQTIVDIDILMWLTSSSRTWNPEIHRETHKLFNLRGNEMRKVDVRVTKNIREVAVLLPRYQAKVFRIAPDLDVLPHGVISSAFTQEELMDVGLLTHDDLYACCPAAHLTFMRFHRPPNTQT